MSTTLRRFAALSVGSALALTGLIRLAGPRRRHAVRHRRHLVAGRRAHRRADAQPDRRRASTTTGSAWTPGFAELGTGNTAVAAQVRDAVAAHINDYITGEGFGDPGSTYAGPTAKALAYAQASGGTPTSFGGVNLVTRLESVVGTEWPHRRRQHLR